MPKGKIGTSSAATVATHMVGACPAVRFELMGGPNQKDECIICLDAVGVPNHEGIAETWVVLHCGHKFGSVCIQRWFQESLHRHDVTSWIAPTCPVYREIARHPDCGHLVYENPWLQKYQHTAQRSSPTTIVYTGLLSRTSRSRRRPYRERADGYHLERDLVMAINVRADEVGFCSTCSTREIAGREEPRKPF